MAYQTGNASSVVDLLSKLAKFAQSVQGWVVDKIDTKAKELYLHNENCFWSLKVATSNSLPTLYIVINNQFNANLPWDNQAGSSTVNGKANFYRYYLGAGTNFHHEPFASYTFLATAQYIHVVVRVDSRRFRHFGIGTIKKCGIYNGGHYAYGTHSTNTNDTSRASYPFTSNMYLFIGNHDSRSSASVIRVEGNDYFFGANESGYEGVGSMGVGDATIERSWKPHPDMMLVDASLSQFNNLITLVPQSIYLHLASKQYHRIGVVPDFYVARIDSVVPGTIRKINGEKYYCCAATMFQTVTENVQDEDNSYDLGYVYRVIE
ncbi:hypothetical protein A9G22_01525 [Gilliamella sp. App2-1]|uniref:hypothetical protein n=1 Tax=Gilliamella sp. App2-1 TaxID=3120230 RepID=UPI0008276E15|nr:hypothetical protein [Gilliamella apicola]OCG20023.1 hypothetical protein A9G22_01525 [Gilliamella apicola]